MKSKFILIIAILLGVFAATLIYLYLNGITTKLEKTKYTEVIVAGKDIGKKTVITEGVLLKKKVPIGFKHPLAVVKVSDIVGRVTLQDITAGEEILTNQVVNIGDRTEGLSFAIPVGKRAMAIAVDDISGVGGMLKPGDWVDVIATLASNETPPVNYTVVVLQNIQVLAVGNVLDSVKNTSETKAPEKKTVTLAVDTKEGLKLKMATERGSVSLMLRPPTDTGTEKQKPVTADDILK